MNPLTLTVTTEATVRIHVSESAPDDWLSRVATADFPYRQADRSPMTADDGIQMLVDNALRNGVHDASRLDGWGDLEHGMVRIEVEAS